MYLVCVDFSVNSLLTEQLNVRSFCDLPVLNISLLEHQLRNFSRMNITKAFVTEASSEIEFPVFETAFVNINDFQKNLYLSDENEKVILFRNDTYFECDISEQAFSVTEDSVAGFVNSDGFCFAACLSVKSLKQLLNKSVRLSEILDNYHKFVSGIKAVEGYTINLKSFKDYRSLVFDILNLKTSYKPPYIAEGIYTDAVVPKGDFSIVPPVYIGNTVQIESGTTIGPNTVIYDNTLISNDSVVKNTILFKNVFVSSNCFIDGSICCENSSVKRNSAVFSDSVIGENSLIGEDVVVENKSIIRKNVKYDNYINTDFHKALNNKFKNKFQGLTPDKTALLGSAMATVFNKPKILIASDGSPNSLAIKLAFLSGLISSGARCFDIGTTFKSNIFFSSIFCECDFSVFFSGGRNGTDVEIYNNDNEPLSKADCNNLIAFCNKKEFVFAEPEECCNVRQINGLKRVYIREITSVFEGDYDFCPVINCKNSTLLKVLKDIFKKMGNDTGEEEKLYIDFNSDGTKLSVEFKGKRYVTKDLKRIVSFFKNKSRKTDLNTDAYEKLWKKDCVFLLFTLLDIIKKTNNNIDFLFRELPDFYISFKDIKNDFKAGETAKKIGELERFVYKNNSYNIPLKNGFVKVINNPDESKLKVFCASDNFAFSRELCDFFSSFLRDSGTLDIKG